MLHLSRSSGFFIKLNHGRSLVSFKDLLGKVKKQPQEHTDEIQKIDKTQDLIASDYEAIKNVESIRLVRVKAYKPPIGIEEQIKNIVLEEYEKEAQVNTDNFKQIKLDNQTKRFNILRKCVSTFKHNMPNTVLNEINDVKDLIDYFSTEVKDTNTLEDMQRKDDLPKNLHINLEYNRYDPEKDNFFNGRDAFASRDTIVPSLWYGKKYKSVYKKKPYFTK